MKTATNKKSCKLCSGRDKCKSLCKPMNELLKNYKNKNDVYSDSTQQAVEYSMDTFTEHVIYTFGLSNIESRDSKRIIVALLSKEQKQILELYAQGLNQGAIAKKLGITQSGVSQKISTIRKILKSGLVAVIPHIV